MRYAIVEQGVVTNVILWNGEDPYSPPEGALFIEAPDEVSIGYGWNGEWVRPVIPEEEIPPEESSEVTAAKERALLELTTMGVSESAARTIVGLPISEPPITQE